MIAVYFENLNTAQIPALSINGGESVQIYQHYPVAAGPGAEHSWNSGAILILFYTEGTNGANAGWVIANWKDDEITQQDIDNIKVENVEITANETLTNLSQTKGVINFNKQKISITKDQVSDFPNSLPNPYSLQIKALPLNSELSTLVTDYNGSALKDILFQSGTVNGTIRVGNVNVGVQGLKDAAFMTSDSFATAGQGKRADEAMPRSGGQFTGDVTFGPLANLTLDHSPSQSMEAATKAYVDTLFNKGIAATEAMIFKGLITSDTVWTNIVLTSSYRAGWTYRVSSVNSFWLTDGNGKNLFYVEPGDLVIAVKTKTALTTDISEDWTVAQTNLVGAVTLEENGAPNKPGVWAEFADLNGYKIQKATPRSLQVLLSSNQPALFDGSENVLIGVNGVLTTTFGGTGNTTGEANSAKKLSTARKINGTDFDGTKDIITTQWGSARDVTISDASGEHTSSAVSVNGGTNFSLKLPTTIKASFIGDLSGNANTATQVKESLFIGLDDGTPTIYNGSVTRTIIITPESIHAVPARKRTKSQIDIYNITTGIYNIENEDIGTGFKYNRIINLGNYTVSPGGYNTQIALPYDSGARHNMFIRWSTTSAWTDWYKIPFSDGLGASGTWGISVTGNAATADKWKTPRTFYVADNNSHQGTAATVDGSANISLKLPTTIQATLIGNLTGDVKGNVTGNLTGNVTGNVSGSSGSCTGNAATADKWKTGRAFYISDSNSHQGTASTVDGSANVSLKLPTTIQAAFIGNLTGNVTGNLTGNVTGNVTGSSGSCTGNAATADKWKTPRTFYIQDYNGSHNGSSISVDGSAANNILKMPSIIRAVQILKTGVSSSWIKGRDNAGLRMDTIDSYSPLISAKTTNGSWEIGPYKANNYHDQLLFTYTTDANYTSNTNTATAQIKFLNNGHIVAALDGNASSASKLTVNAGATNNPVYFANGVPVATGDTLAKNITGSAAKLSVNAGSVTRPVYFTNGIPTVTTYNLATNVFAKTINGSFSTAFRTQTFGSSGSGDFIANIRNDTASVANSPQHGTGLAWGRGDTHGYLYMSHSASEIYMGAGSADKLTWVARIPTATGSGASGTWGISISGNAATATKLQTARTINGTNFDGTSSIITAQWGYARTLGVIGDVVGSVSVNGTANVNATVLRRGCIVGQSGSTATKPWYKFASASTNTGYIDLNIVFNVYAGCGDSSSSVGILIAHFRTNGNGQWEQSQLVWLNAASGIDTAKFVLAHNSGASPTIVELWVKIDSAYRFYHFDVIAEGHRTDRATNVWTLYNTSSAGSQDAITNGYVQQASSLATLKNNISGTATALATSAGSLSQPVYFLSGKPVVTNLVGGTSIMRSMFDAALTGANYIPVFTDSWADGGYMSKQQLRNAMGLGNTLGALPTVNGGTGLTSFTANRLIYASSASALASTGNISYIPNTSVKVQSTNVNQNGIRIWGATYGNTASTLLSNTVGVMSYGDGGPQIQFSTGAAAAQDGALIFTDNDNAGSGVSWHFVSNQNDWSVNSKRFVAKTSVTIGQNLPNTGYTLYNNGASYFNGATTVTGVARFNSTGDSTATTNGAVIINGGVGIAKQLRVGTNISSDGSILLNRKLGNGKGYISYYNSSYITWINYMNDATASPVTTKSSTIGTVTSWAMRSLIENSSAYGWIWESATNKANSAVTAQMGLNASTGNLYVRGTVTAPTFSGALSGNASSATKLQTARQINGTNFDGTANITTNNWGQSRTLGTTGDVVGSVSVNGGANATATMMRRGCVVGQTSNTAGSNTWFKFASISSTAGNTDFNIIFLVDSGGYSGTIRRVGILSCHMRTGATISTSSLPSIRMEWLTAAQDIDTNGFKSVLVISGSTATLECWCNCNWSWGLYHFTVLSEDDRVNQRTNLWTLYNTKATSGSASTTTGSSSVVSTLSTLKNGINGNAATASKLGTTTVGGTTKPIYLNGGTPTAFNTTIGSSTKPVYINAGTITAFSSTLGGTAKPVYLSSGSITACSATVGSGTKPVYMSSGTITVSNSTVGTSSRPVYMSSGTITACGSTIGSSTTPVYMSGGIITACSNLVARTLKFYNDTNYTDSQIENHLVEGLSIVESKGPILTHFNNPFYALTLKGPKVKYPVQLGFFAINRPHLLIRNGYTTGEYDQWFEIPVFYQTGTTTGVGSNKQPIYIDSDGEIQRCGAQVGSPSKPIYMNAGVPTECGLITASNIQVTKSTSKNYVVGVSTTTTGSKSLYVNSSVYTSGSVLYNAAWNDYAEFRQTRIIIEAGRCVREVGDGTLVMTTKRLERGCEIVSDTYGFAIGENDICKTPIASTGRVLAYPDKPASTFEIGAPVCSGPNGTVSQMTEEEERIYPSRIIGTVSEIPTYTIWKGGNDVPVKGRIWIRIR